MGKKKKPKQDDMDLERHESVMSKKKKRKHEGNNATDEPKSPGEDEDHEILTKKKKRKKEKASNHEDTEEYTNLREDESRPKKKKKKKKSKTKDEDSVDMREAQESSEGEENVVGDTSKNKKKKKKSKDVNGESNTTEFEKLVTEGEIMRKEKKKDKKSHHKVIENEENVIKTKKKKQKAKCDEADVVDNWKDGVVKVNKKKRKHESERNHGEINVAHVENNDFKKTKKDKSAKIFCEKESIRKEKLTQEPMKQVEKTTVTVGQWGTAEFESTVKQNKFLRLLGGMKDKTVTSEKNGKKGLFGGLAALAGKSGNSAMTNAEQAKWAQSMENQFDKALMYKTQRGGGIGFEKPPEEGKKFHIHVNKSNSIKFDD